jgi:hypothetical protein
MRKIAKDMFYNVVMVSLEEIYEAITGQRHPGGAKGETLWQDVHRELRARGFDEVSIYLGGEDGHIAVYGIKKRELIRVDDASKILDLARKVSS